ncbi:tRNA:m(4)X modification enzyme TRM13 homolog [Rhizophagus clarus]|uniref:tRNA:m(4)X modification enzyme TRM13 n=1 Tax=Rhizophagus clarus TaxID=94130 RepID=A0A8H3QB34_9GLOM|nr:tRNA:m(4)X modification enzyme TRM13 homolog [Rhizophagus clarus]
MPKGPKAKRLKEGPPPPPPDNPRQCHFWVKHKRKVNDLERYCHLPTKIDNDFCGEHAIYDTKWKGKERIVCPYDPSHTVNKDEIEKHLEKKCNSRPPPTPPYFSSNINCTLPSPELEEKVTLSDLSKETVDKLISNVNQWHQQLVPDIKTEVMDHMVLKDKKESTKNRKHAVQQASLIGHLEKLNLLRKNICFMEYGSGKGELSYFIKMAIQDDTASFILVDRKNTRCKFDSVIRGTSEKKLLVKRIGMDIKDLDISKLDLLKGKNVVAYSKHLCGSATDITLKSLVDYAKSSIDGNPVIGIIIALCCHQLCRYHMFPYHKFLQDYGITENDFKRICAMSSWAICGQRLNHETENNDNDDNDNDDNDNEDDHTYNETEDEEENTKMHYSGLEHSAREQLGYKCKRIIDIGRAKYLEANGFFFCMKENFRKKIGQNI